MPIPRRVPRRVPRLRIRSCRQPEPVITPLEPQTNHRLRPSRPQPAASRARREQNLRAEDRDHSRLRRGRGALVGQPTDGGAGTARPCLWPLPGVSPQARRRPQPVLRRQPDRARHVRYCPDAGAGISRRHPVCRIARTLEPLQTIDELVGTARGLAEALSGMVQDSKACRCRRSARPRCAKTWRAFRPRCRGASADVRAKIDARGKRSGSTRSRAEGDAGSLQLSLSRAR